MQTKCPYDCKCTRKIIDYCCAEKGFVCTAKEKDSLAQLEQLMIENADVLKRLKER